jgi:rhodanese-related sulfurtransferase
MSQPPGTIPVVNVNAAAEQLERGGSPAPMLVDVRETDEFRTARVAGAVLIPMSTFVEGHVALPKDRPLLMMCAGGTRSAAATGFLLRNGWPDVANVAGGITAWQGAGLPVRRGEPDPGEGELGR